MNFQPSSVFLKPTPDTGILVIRSVVLNQMDPVCPGTATGCGHLFEEAEIRLGVKDRIAAVNEFGFLEIDGSKDLHTFSGPRHRDEGLDPDPRPRLMEC